MPTQVQFRKGTTAQHASFTGANGEITIDTDKKTVVVHDGSTAGGIPLARETVLTSAFNKANSSLANDNIVITGNVTSTKGISDSIGSLRNIPINNQSATYVLTLSDNGQVVSTNSNVTVPNAIFFAGNTISVFNNSGANITISNASSVTLYSAGTANVGSRVLQQRGIATLVCVSSNTFIITGAGIVP